MDLIPLLEAKEEWLIERILFYAKRQQYTRYTSTLKDAWRLSIQELSKALKQGLSLPREKLEFLPEEDFTKDPISAFGIVEAHRHRARGIDIGMFFGLFKYYRQCYFDLVENFVEDPHQKPWAMSSLLRLFDRIEVGFCHTWGNLSTDAKEHDLQEMNRKVTNEKNKYLTAIESITMPIFFFSENRTIEYLNHAASEFLGLAKIPGEYYFHPSPTAFSLPSWLQERIDLFYFQKLPSTVLEYAEEGEGEKHSYLIQLYKMLDVSQKFQGIIVILYDITRQEQFRKTNEQLEKRVKDRTSKLEKTLLSLQEREETQTVLLREVNHRVKNNLAALIGLLHLEQDRPETAMNPTYNELLDCLVGRIRALATVHSMLSATQWKPLSLSDLCQQIIQNAVCCMTISEKVFIQVEDCGFQINGNQAHHLTLVMNELATNTVKYALRGKENARIEVKIQQNDGKVSLQYRDDGPGYPQAVLEGRSGSMHVGFGLIEGIVHQSLGGAVRFLNDRGAMAILEWSAENYM